MYLHTRSCVCLKLSTIYQGMFSRMLGEGAVVLSALGYSLPPHLSWNKKSADLLIIQRILLTNQITVFSTCRQCNEHCEYEDVIFFPTC